MLHAIETSEHFSTFCLYFAWELLQKAKQRVERIFPRRGNALKRKSRKQKQNRRKADKRKCQRYAENEKSIKTRILNVDEETLNDEDYVIDHGDLEMRVVKAHIGSKILTSIVQEKQTNIPLASDSNPESDSDSDSDRVEGIVGSSSNSSELNDSGDQAADRQQLEQETIPESSTSRYGRKRTRVLRENYVPWNNIHVDTQ